MLWLWPPLTQCGDRHDRVMYGPPRVAKPDGGSDSMRSRASELVPRIHALLSFQGPLRACAGDSPGRHDPPRRRPASTIAPEAAAVEAASRRRSPCATRRRLWRRLPTWSTSPSSSVGGHVERPASTTSPSIRTAALVDQAARLAAAEAEVLAPAAPAGGPPRSAARLHHGLGDVVGDLAVARGAGRSAPPRRPPRPAPWKRSHEPPRELALGLARMRARGRAAPRAAARSTPPSPRRGRSSASRTSPPGHR